MVTLDTARSENVEQITELTATVKANAKTTLPHKVQAVYRRYTPRLDTM